MRQAMGILGVGLLALLLDRTQTQSDEPTPSRVADLATLTARVSDLERRDTRGGLLGACWTE
jgi:hypothetical protein